MIISEHFIQPKEHQKEKKPKKQANKFDKPITNYNFFSKYNQTISDEQTKTLFLV